jgi:hypothetical protein
MGRAVTDEAKAKALQAVFDAATPAVVGALRRCVEEYVENWYVRSDGSKARLRDAGPVGTLMAALDDVARLRL